jgi:TonB family protein
MAHLSRFRSSSTAPAGQRSSVIRPERTPKVPSPNLDSQQELAELRSAVAIGDLDLNSSLQRIAEVAQSLTGATGAAIAIRHNGRVVCLARAGEIAPDLGAPVDVNSGISGECLRTGQALCCGDTYEDLRVDVEVCRRLGLRSLAVVPLLAELGVIGVLEAFSDMPHAFPDRHLQILRELAELVAAARIRFAEEQNSVPMGSLAEEPSTPPRAVLWARGKDLLVGFLQTLHLPVARALDQDQTSRLGGLEMTGVIGLAVTALAVVVVFAAIRRPALPGHSRPTRLSEVHAVAESNPGQSSTDFPSSAPSRSVSSLFLFRSPTRGAITNNRKPSPASARTSEKGQLVEMAEDLVLRAPDPDASSGSTPTQNPPPTSTISQAADEQSLQEVDPLATSVPATSPNPLSGVISSNPTVPAAALPVSQGISEGVVEHRVQPVYPEQARSLRLEGQVVLRATVTENGALRDLKVLSGHPLLARAALDAVSKWRYRPYQLNGKPIAMQTNVTIDFKLP